MTLASVPDQKPESALPAQLAARIELASKIVYQVDQPTPCEPLRLPDGKTVFAKREDVSIIHSYKWRGATFKMHQLIAQGNSGPFVAASAGNHAQGVALAAEKFGVPAVIFMPVTTPRLKTDSVKRLGQNWVDIRLTGDNFDDSLAAARSFLEIQNGTMIEPFDDLDVIAGQATVGLEMFRQRPEISKLYVPVGGGGLASGIAFVAREVLGHACKIVGVEVENQNSTQRSLAARQRISMDFVDRFCDGTAVRQPGELTLRICREYLDDVVTVTNNQVSIAMQAAWDAGRFVPEPSGAISLAAALQFSGSDFDQTVAVVVTGSNMDFGTFPRIVRKINSARKNRRYFQFQIDETHGSLIRLLDELMGDMNIVDFQYGKNSTSIAHPVLGIEAAEDRFAGFLDRLRHHQYSFREVGDQAFTEFRVIPFQTHLCRNPLYLKIDFPDRPGALRELMRRISQISNICYFNFVDSGETEGHALIGFELPESENRAELERHLAELNLPFRQAVLA